MKKYYRTVDHKLLNHLLRIADEMYADGWDLIHIESETLNSLWYNGVFRKARKK